MKWIEFRELQKPPGRKTSQFEVNALESRELLGFVEWFGRWRKFAFRPITSDSTWFEEDCLRLIADFCVEQTHLYKASEDWLGPRAK